MRAVLTMALKDIRLLWRDKFGLFWVIVFPLLMASFFGSIYSIGEPSAGSMRVAVTDQQQSEESRAFVAQLGEKEVLRLVEMPLEQARQKVQLGHLTAYVLIKQDAGSDGYNPFAMPPMEIGIDPARKAEAGYLRGMVTEAWFQQVSERMTDVGKAREWVDGTLATLDDDASMSAEQRTILKALLGKYAQFMTTVDTTEPQAGSPFGQANVEQVEVAVSRRGVRSGFEITFPQALTWALLACTLTFALSIVAERTRGTYLRLRIAPVSRAQILAGKGLACFFTAFAVCLMLVVVGVVILGVRLESVAAMAIALLASAACFVGLMMLISVVGRTEQGVGGAGWAVMLVVSMAGGGMVPLFVMPSWMRAISNVSVVKWAIVAFEGAIWRGFTLWQMMLPAGILVAVGLAAYAVGVAVLVRSDR